VRLGAGPSFGLDLEFQRERTYHPRLCLIQVALPGRAAEATAADGAERLAIVDPQVVRDLGPFWDLVADPSIEKVLHAGRQDMEIAWGHGGVLPRNIVDTQIAAALIGAGDQPGYGTLVERFCGVRLSKTETVTDWSRRPLTPEQIDYALDDVRYLHDIRDTIGRRLAELGREEWAREEMAHYEEESTWDPDLSRLFLKLPRLRSLPRKSLVVARELAIWREEEARRRDEPRNRIVSDEVLVEVARRLPKNQAQIDILRGLHPNEARRIGAPLLEVVARAQTIPESEWPELRAIPAEDTERALVVDLLEVFLRSRARESEIAPSYLGVKADLAALVDEVRGKREPGAEPPLLLTGWRRTMVGDDLVAIAQGRINLHVDAASGRVTTSDR
jgi:ribonuclease D